MVREPGKTIMTRLGSAAATAMSDSAWSTTGTLFSAVRRIYLWILAIVARMPTTGTIATAADITGVINGSSLNAAIPASNTADSVNDVLLDQLKPVLPLTGTIATTADLKPLTELESIQGTTTETTYQTLLDVTGSGKLYNLVISDLAADKAATVKVTIDGNAHELATASTHDTAQGLVFNTDPTSSSVFALSTTIPGSSLGIDFQDGLKIEYKTASAGTARAKAIYGVR